MTNTAVAHLEFRPPIVNNDPIGMLAAASTREQLNRGIDELSLRFVIASRTAKGPVLDFGCGSGAVAAAALTRGAHVYVQDSDEAAINRLLSRVPSQEHRRLHAHVGSLHGGGFKGVHFDAIHAARVLHEFDGEGIEALLRRFCRWLSPNGRLFLSALAPEGSFWDSLRREFEHRRAEGLRWPGYIEETLDFRSTLSGAMPIHLLDEGTLRRELEAAGFTIVDTHCYLLPWDATQVCCSFVARRSP